MVVVPADAPVTTPDEEPTVAIPVLPLVHVPPDGELLYVVVEPIHTDVVPEIDPGLLFTQRPNVEKQPLESV